MREKKSLFTIATVYMSNDLLEYIDDKMEYQGRSHFVRELLDEYFENEDLFDSQLPGTKITTLNLQSKIKEKIMKLKKEKKIVSASEFIRWIVRFDMEKKQKLKKELVEGQILDLFSAAELANFAEQKRLIEQGKKIMKLRTRENEIISISIPDLRNQLSEAEMTAAREKYAAYKVIK